MQATLDRDLVSGTRAFMRSWDEVTAPPRPDPLVNVPGGRAPRLEVISRPWSREVGSLIGRPAEGCLYGVPQHFENVIEPLARLDYPERRIE